MILTISEFFGRFHPVFVHLPIGMLVLAVLFDWLSGNPRGEALRPSIPVILALGFVAALFSCITGWLLSGTADYETGLVNTHQWLAIATTVVAGWMLGLHARAQQGAQPDGQPPAQEAGPPPVQPARYWSLLLLLLLLLTGHYGGSLTHGEDYLTEALVGAGGKQSTGPVLDSVPQIQEAAVYQDLVQPILEARCTGCHGDTKQKGGLRLDTEQYILAGGEEGEVLGTESELVKRLRLPLEAKKHMPPRNKSQLTAAEIELLHWWVSNGAPFGKKVKELKQEGSIASALSVLEKGGEAGGVAGGSAGTGGTAGTTTSPNDLLPVGTVRPPDTAAVNGLRRVGVAVVPVARDQNWLSVNFASAQGTGELVVKQLEGLQQQVVALKMEDLALGLEHLQIIGKLRQLRSLSLARSVLTGADLAALKDLKELRSLNLVGTAVSLEDLKVLQQLPKLRVVYLYRSGVLSGMEGSGMEGSSNWKALQALLPGVQLDSGQYHLPMLESDTTEIKW